MYGPADAMQNQCRYGGAKDVQKHFQFSQAASKEM